MEQASAELHTVLARLRGMRTASGTMLRAHSCMPLREPCISCSHLCAVALLAIESELAKLKSIDHGSHPVVADDELAILRARVRTMGATNPIMTLPSGRCRCTAADFRHDGSLIAALSCFRASTVMTLCRRGRLGQTFMFCGPKLDRSSPASACNTPCGSSRINMALLV